MSGDDFTADGRMWDYLAAFTAIVLAVLGIVPAVTAFSGTKRRLWIAGIIAAVLVSGLAYIFSLRSMHADQEQLLVGGNCPHVLAVITNPTDPKASFPLFINNDQPVPVYDVSLQVVDKERLYRLMQSGGSQAEYLDAAYPKPIPVGTVPALNAFSTRADDIALPVGRYQINIQTRRTFCADHLTLSVENGQVRESRK